jgi:hypothetical protein
LPSATCRDADIPDDIEPQSIQPVGNYAVQISWQDGFSQVAAYELLDALPRLPAEEARQRQQRRAAEAAAAASSSGSGADEPSAAQQILASAQALAGAAAAPAAA